MSDTTLKKTEKLPQAPLLYHPGDQWVYSVAHDVQAYLVEYFSGMPFDQYLQKAIFGPLQMRDTYFGVWVRTVRAG